MTATASAEEVALTAALVAWRGAGMSTEVATQFAVLADEGEFTVKDVVTTKEEGEARRNLWSAIVDEASDRMLSGGGRALSKIARARVLDIVLTPSVTAKREEGTPMGSPIGMGGGYMPFEPTEPAPAAAPPTKKYMGVRSPDRWTDVMRTEMNDQGASRPEELVVLAVSIRQETRPAWLRQSAVG